MCPLWSISAKWSSAKRSSRAWKWSNLRKVTSSAFTREAGSSKRPSASSFHSPQSKTISAPISHRACRGTLRPLATTHSSSSPCGQPRSRDARTQSAQSAYSRVDPEIYKAASYDGSAEPTAPLLHRRALWQTAWIWALSASVSLYAAYWSTERPHLSTLIGTAPAQAFSLDP